VKLPIKNAATPHMRFRMDIHLLKLVKYLRQKVLWKRKITFPDPTDQNYQDLQLPYSNLSQKKETFNRHFVFFQV
jgi:hypothetical protein